MVGTDYLEAERIWGKRLLNQKSNIKNQNEKYEARNPKQINNQGSWVCQYIGVST